MDMHLFFNISNLSFGNSDNKCLKSLSSKFPTKESNEALQNCRVSKNIILLLTIILIYLSFVSGITWITISLKLFSSLKYKCPSYPSKLWKTIGNFLGILDSELHFLWAAPVVFTCYMTMISCFIFIINYFFITYPTILRILIIIFIFYCQFQFFVKMFVNYLITILNCSKTHSINSLILLLPVKVLVGKVKLLSIQTNFAPNFWYVFYIISYIHLY